MTKKFDLVAIGTGSGASSVASACRAGGWQVAIIDSRPFGGTCALRGCDPKKVLVGASEVVDWCRRMKGKGVKGDAVRIEWPELMLFKRSFTGPKGDRLNPRQYPKCSHGNLFTQTHALRFEVPPNANVGVPGRGAA